MNETKKLYRLDNGVLAGVCGGVAEYFNVDANVVRLIWVALCFAGTAGFWRRPCCCPRRARCIRATEAGKRNGGRPKGRPPLFMEGFG